MRGKVKWFDAAKGYGFIIPEDVESAGEVFVHHTDIDMKGFRDLKENWLVEFDVERGDRGRKAKQVRVVES